MNELDEVRRAFGDEPSDPGARERARVRLRSTIRGPVRTGAPRRRAILAASLATLAATAALFGALILSPGAAPSAAARELLRLRSLASGLVEPSMGPGDVLWMRAVEMIRRDGPDLSGFTPYRLEIRSTRVILTFSDGRTRERTKIRAVTFLSDADRRAWVEAGKPRLPKEGDLRIHDVPAARSPWFDLGSLPSEPDELVARLREGRVSERHPGDDRVFLIIGELLARADTPGALRAALFDAAARLDGIELLGIVDDPDGRKGVGLALKAETGRTVLIFDPDTGRLLAIERESTQAEGQLPELVRWTAFKPARIIDGGA